MEENEMEEWEIVSYCCNSPNYSLGSEEDDRIISNIDDEIKSSKQSKLGWVVSSGVSIGKKLVVTGLLISSAPLVVPPLVVISALGCALSIPFGVVFATYACTDSLMSKLLLPSPPPLMLEYDYEKTDEDEQERDDEQVAFAYEKEEEEEQKDVKDAVEMRIELVDTHDDESVDDVIDVQPQQQTENAAKTTDEEEERQEDVNVGGGSGEDVSTLQVQTAEERKSSSKEVVVEEVAAVHRKEVDDKNVEKIVAATVKLGTTNKDTIKGSKIGGSKETERRGKRKTLSALKFPRKRQESGEGDKRHIEKPSGEEKAILEKKTDQTLDLADQGKLGSGEKQSRPDELGEEKAGENKDFSKQVLEKEEKLVGSKEGVDSSESSLEKEEKPAGMKEGVKNSESSLEKEKKPAGMKEMSKEGQSVEDDERDTTNYTATAIAATDGGFDEKIEHRSVTIYGDPGEKDNQSEKIAVDGDHSLEIAAPLAVVPELKHDDEVMIPEVKGEKDANLVDSGLRTSDADEKIWKKMDAVRVIVGYKAPIRGSYVEELKALYLFTGIEPPADSADFQNKLCFLMSVIGLK